MGARSGPIGVFDSGVGGLAILRELRGLLPAEDFVYFADQANFPYGPRPAAEVERLALAAAERLTAYGIKLLVVACNTASSAALPSLRARFTMPIVGIEPALKPASAVTRNGRIGLLATDGTVQGTALDNLARRVAGEAQVYRVPAPELVELVERGEARLPSTLQTLETALAPLIEAQVDVVVLGCTHFAFLQSAVKRVLGPGVQVLEPAAAVAVRAADVLRQHGLQRDADAGVRGTVEYVSSKDSALLVQAAESLDAVLRSGIA